MKKYIIFVLISYTFSVKANFNTSANIINQWFKKDSTLSKIKVVKSRTLYMIKPILASLDAIYVGVVNPVKISCADSSEYKKIKIEVSGCHSTFHATENQSIFDVFATNPGIVVVSVFIKTENGDKLVLKKSLICKNLPIPNVVIRNQVVKQKINMKQEDLKEFNHMSVVCEKISPAHHNVLVSFKVVIPKVKPIMCLGPLLSLEAKNEISKLKKGDRITLTNIVVSTPVGKITLKPITININ